MKSCVWVLLLLCGLAQGEQRVVMPGGLREAVAQARDGDVLDLLPGEYKGESITLDGKRLTLRGMGGTPVLSGANGAVGPGGALLHVRSGDVTVENLEIRGARAPDGNGAGIRLDAGRLRLVNSQLFDNEVGLVTGHDASAEVVVEDSIFGLAPRVVGSLPHLLHAGRIGKLTVTGSRFHQGFEGHLVKSRARETRLSYNVIYDGTRGQASYEVDLPNGGQAWLIGNVIGQATTTQNPVVVAYGSEGSRWPLNNLYMAHNTLINHQLLPGWFLRVFSDRLPDAARVHVVNNLLVGGGVMSWGAAGEFAGNWPALRSALASTEALNFGLDGDIWAAGRGVDPRNIGGQDLSPKLEFKPPLGTRALTPPARWTPGAYQR